MGRKLVSVLANLILVVAPFGLLSSTVVAKPSLSESAVAVASVLAHATQVSAGGYHTCAVTSGGAVKCWGYNAVGMLGDGTVTDRVVPVDVFGLTSGVVAVAAGGTHTCALVTGGSVKCWGQNYRGQLGDGTATDRHTPVDVAGLGSGLVAITAGEEYTCALTGVGGVKCWGLNVDGQLGIGLGYGSLFPPTDVIGLGSGVSAIAASVSGSHTCALTTAGGVKCWGRNNNGQIGDGTTTKRLVPVDVTILPSGVVSVVLGSGHTCALRTSGGVKCWGFNYNGQIGDGTTTDRFAPEDVTFLTSGVNAITAGFAHTCALTNGGGVKCWGHNSSGSLGDGTVTERHTPVDVTGLNGGVTSISAGKFHTCALRSDGGIKCWGNNVRGQLGNGSMQSTVAPVDVVGFGGDPPTPTDTPASTPTPSATLTNTPAPTATPTGVPPANKAWTMMLYLAGDNNLYGYLDRAFAALEASAANPNVNVVVLFDGDRTNDSWRFVVQPGGVYQINVNKWYLGEVNMGHPQTLSDFVAWSREHYPADHYYLSIADHGRGTSGVAWDDSSNRDYLTTSELRSALNTVTNSGQWKIDVLHYDACLMAMLEDAYQVKDVVNYQVSSENLGWSVFAFANYAQEVSGGGTQKEYAFPVSRVQIDAVTTPRQLAVSIAGAYFNHPSVTSFPRTVSVLDLGQAATVKLSVDSLASALRTNMNAIKVYLQNTRSATQKFDSRDYYQITQDDEYLDLYHFASRLKQYVSDTSIQSAAQGVIDSINAGFVVTESHMSGVWSGDQDVYWDLDNSHGVSIYFPPRSGSNDYNAYIGHQKFQFTVDSQWDDFLQDYFGAVGLPPETTTDSGIPPMLGARTQVFLPSILR